MIKLVRNRTHGAIPPSFRGAARIEREMEKLAKWRRDSLAGATSAKLSSALWKSAKKQLLKETDALGGGKCAFCESRTVRFHCDVEHFRPKSSYWWLALCWDNYTFSCQLCNQVYKNDRFDIKGIPMPEPPVDATTTDADLAVLAGSLAPDPADDPGMSAADLDGARKARHAYSETCQREKAGMVHPYDDDPETFFKWVADDVRRQVKPVPAATSGHRKWRAENSIETLGLDADDLSTERWRIYTLFVAFCAVVQNSAPGTSIHQTALEQVDAMTADDATYAGMCRAFRTSFGL